MVKKRLGRSSWKNKGHTKKLRFLGMPPNKSAQITVFLILGLLLLFIFMITIKLASDTKLSNLEAEKERVVSKTFKKEALRIYVQDCLNDALEAGLVLIGKQGRLWQGQPGGTKPFVEEITGVTYQPGERIFYGISNENYIQHQNAYPCENDSYAPEFCQYLYPNTSIGFGSREIKTSTIEGDLRKYLINRTIFCVKNFTESEISDKTKIEDTKINLKLDFTNDGINVNVEYPLKLSLGKEEFFHISKFDFFYPTKFNILLDAAVARPLFYDWKFIGFNYTEQTLQKKNFDYASNADSCDDNVCQGTLLYDKYESLAIEMDNISLANGDTILIFKSPEILNLPEPYEFRFAIQNRPPALDYVSQFPCFVEDDPDNSYDYLAIPGHDEYGEIDITLNALDADGDVVTYGFDSTESLELINDNSDDPKKFIVKNVDLPAKIYHLEATATDEHGLSDWQEVRVLVDDSLTFGPEDFEVFYPYMVEKGNELVPYSDLVETFISSEDPFFINVTYPKVTYGDFPTLKLGYQKGEEYDELATLPKPETLSDQPVCYDLSGVDDFCNPNSYFLKYELLTESPEEGISGGVESTGKLLLSSTKNYCANNLGSKTEIDVTIKECIPHVNPDHPFPYIKNDDKKLYQLYDCDENNDNCKIDEDFSPFLATHVCCNPDWEYYEADDFHECYREEEEFGCFGGTDADPIGGSILVKRVPVTYCSGTSGIVCDGDKKSPPEPHENKCGNEDIYLNCNKVDQVFCKDEEPYSYDFVKGFFCDGDYGCGKGGTACTEIAVDANGDGSLGKNDECRDCNSEDIGPCWDLKTGQPGNCNGASCIPIT